MKAVTDLLKQGVDKGDFPGCSYAIVDNSGHLDLDYLGFKELKPNPIKNNGDEIYDCASLTKVVCTTTSIMQLVEKGHLSLETKISDILKAFKHKEITVKHLLTHTSGLPADIPGAKSLESPDMVKEKVYEFDLINKIGQKVVYSDIGFILLGFIVETISGLPLDLYARDHIFIPLDMDDSSFHPDINRAAPTEFRDDDVFKGLLRGQVHDEKAFALGGVAGHAGMFSTPKDLAKFIHSLLVNDEKILKTETVDLLFKLQASSKNERGIMLHRSLGWDKPSIGGTAGDFTSFEDTIVHTGFTGCNMWIERSRGIGFVMLSNAVHPLRTLNNIIKYRNQIGNLILSSRRKD